MLYLLICIVIGFSLRRAKILPDNSSKVMAKLETWVFCPALNFVSMATYCTVESFSQHATNILLSCIIIAIALIAAILLSKVFVPQRCYERGVYAYALMFGNFGFLADPLVIALFGDAMFAYYKLFTMPLSILCYVWGISVLVPSDKSERGFMSVIKKVFIPPTIALLLGIFVGFLGIYDTFPLFLTDTLTSLKSCMGPVAMILAGFTIAGYPMKRMLTNKKVYYATALRLVVIPSFLIAAIFGFITLLSALGLDAGKNAIFFVFFAYATPLGMNTIVFPEAYGANPETGASMAMISHTLSVITIPILYTVMTLIFGSPILPI